MDRFKPYSELTESEIRELGTYLDSGRSEIRLPVRLVHPIDAHRTKLLDFRYSVDGSDGRLYLFFTPHEKVRGPPQQPCGLHLRTQGKPNKCIPHVILRADCLLVDFQRKELIGKSDLKQLQKAGLV